MLDSSISCTACKDKNTEAAAQSTHWLAARACERQHGFELKSGDEEVRHDLHLSQGLQGGEGLEASGSTEGVQTPPLLPEHPPPPRHQCLAPAHA